MTSVLARDVRPLGRRKSRRRPMPGNLLLRETTECPPKRRRTTLFGGSSTCPEPLIPETSSDDYVEETDEESDEELLEDILEDIIEGIIRTIIIRDVLNRREATAAPSPPLTKRRDIIQKERKRNPIQHKQICKGRGAQYLRV